MHDTNQKIPQDASFVASAQHIENLEGVQNMRSNYNHPWLPAGVLVQLALQIVETVVGIIRKAAFFRTAATVKKYSYFAAYEIII